MSRPTVVVLLLLLALVVHARRLTAQTCPEPWVLRTAPGVSCPIGSDCSTKNAQLTWAELDAWGLNGIGLCLGPGAFAWPAPSAGVLRSDVAGVLTLVADDDVPEVGDFAAYDPTDCTAGSAVTAVTAGVLVCSPFLRSTDLDSESELEALVGALLTPAEGDALYAPLSHAHAAADISSGILASARLPDATTLGKGAVVLATAGEATAGEVPQADDPRLSDSRAPTTHAPTHAAAGSDPLALEASQVAGLAASATTDTTNAGNISSGTLPSARVPAAAVTQHEAALEGVLDLPDLQGVANPFQVGTGTPAAGKYLDGSGAWITLPSTSAAGVDGQIIFNDGGAQAGDPGLTFQKLTDSLTLGGNIVMPGSSYITFGTANGNSRIKDMGGSGGMHVKTGDDLYYQTWSAGNIRSHTYDGNLRLWMSADSSRFYLDQNSCIGWYSGSSMSGAEDATLCRNSSGLVEASGMKAARLVTSAQAFSIPDNGNGGSRATTTLTPATSYATGSCNDAQGCDVTVSEAGAVDGQVLRIVCVSVNACGFSDTPGVTEMAGNFDMGQNDAISFIYSIDRWVETGRSDN